MSFPIATLDENGCLNDLDCFPVEKNNCTDTQC